jgi:hypothetical protein
MHQVNLTAGLRMVPRVAGACGARVAVGCESSARNAVCDGTLFTLWERAESSEVAGGKSLRGVGLYLRSVKMLRLAYASTPVDNVE